MLRAEMLEDSVIVFTTDNGGPAAGYDMNAASNYPLKGVSAFLSSAQHFVLCTRGENFDTNFQPFLRDA